MNRVLSMVMGYDVLINMFKKPIIICRGDGAIQMFKEGFGKQVVNK